MDEIVTDIRSRGHTRSHVSTGKNALWIKPVPLHDTRAGDGIASPRHGSQLLLLAAILLLVTAEAATAVAIVVAVVLLAAAAVTIPALVENLLTLALFLLFVIFLQ